MGNCYTPVSSLPSGEETTATAIIHDHDSQNTHQFVSLETLPPLPPSTGNGSFQLPGDSSFVVRLPTMSVASTTYEHYGTRLRRSPTFLGQGHLLLPQEAQLLEVFFRKSKIWGRVGFMLKLLLTYLTESDPWPRLSCSKYVKATRTFRTRCRPMAMIDEGTVLRILKWNSRRNMLVDCEKLAYSQWLSPEELVSVEGATKRDYKCEFGSSFMAPEAAPLGWKLEAEREPESPGIAPYENNLQEAEVVEEESCSDGDEDLSDFIGLPRKLSSERVSTHFQEQKSSPKSILSGKNAMSGSTDPGLKSPRTRKGTLSVKDGFAKQVSWADQVLEQVNYYDTSLNGDNSGPDDLVWLISDANKSDYASQASNRSALSSYTYKSEPSSDF